MNYFEYFVVGFVLTFEPTWLFNKKARAERRYILDEIKQGRGIL